MICECGHEFDEHDDGGCTAMIEDGGEWWTCSCEMFDAAVGEETP